MDSNRKKLVEGIIPNEETSSGFIPNNEDKQYIQGLNIDTPTKSFEDKTFIILYKINDDSENGTQNIYTVCTGRTDAYLDIKNRLISGEDINIHKSVVITETKQTETSSGNRKYYLIPLNECLSVYSFCTSVREYYSNDTFDIEDYNNDEIQETPVEQVQLTKEQESYKRMLMAAIKQDKFVNSLRMEKSESEDNNI